MTRARQHGASAAERPPRPRRGLPRSRAAVPLAPPWTRTAPRRPRPGRPRRRGARLVATSRVRRVRDAARPRLRAGLRAALGRVRRARRDGAARGDRGAPRLGPGAAGRRRAPSPTSSSCCAGAARRGAARPHRRRAPRRARAAARRARSSCTSRTRSSSPRTAAAGSPPGCARSRSQAARRCAAAAGCAAGRAVVLVAEMEPPTPPSPRGWRGCAPTSAPASGSSTPRRRPTRSRTSGRPRSWPATRPQPMPLGLVLRRVGREAEDDDARGRGRRRRRGDLRGVRRARAGRRARPAARRGGPLDRSPADASACYLPRRDHGLPPPGLRGADRRPRDADAEVPAGGGRPRGPAGRARRGAGADRARGRCCASTRAAYLDAVRSGRAARARRVAEVPVVAGALAVGAAHERRRARRGARALDDGVAAALASGFHHSHADHGEGFCTFNGLVVAAEALRAAGRVRTVAVLDLDLHYGNGTASLCAVAALALQLLDLRQRLLAEHALPRRRDRAPRGRPEPRLVRAAERQRARGAARRRSSAASRRSSPGAGPTSCSTRPAPTPTARTPTRRSTSTTTTCASATACVFAWARREGLPLAWVLAGGYTQDVSKVVDVHLGTFDAARRRAWLSERRRA